MVRLTTSVDSDVTFRPGRTYYRGSENHCTIYAQIGDEPSSDDELVGVAVDPDLALETARALTGEPTSDHHPVWGSDEWTARGRLIFRTPPEAETEEFVVSLIGRDAATAREWAGMAASRLPRRRHPDDPPGRPPRGESEPGPPATPPGGRP